MPRNDRSSCSSCTTPNFRSRSTALHTRWLAVDQLPFGVSRERPLLPHQPVDRVGIVECPCASGASRAARAARGPGTGSPHAARTERVANAACLRELLIAGAPSPCSSVRSARSGASSGASFPNCTASAAVYTSATPSAAATSPAWTRPATPDAAPDPAPRGSASRRRCSAGRARGPRRGRGCATGTSTAARSRSSRASSPRRPASVPGSSATRSTACSQISVARKPTARTRSSRVA